MGLPPSDDPPAYDASLQGLPRETSSQRRPAASRSAFTPAPTSGSWIQAQPNDLPRPAAPPDAQRAIAPLTVTGSQCSGVYRISFPVEGVDPSLHGSGDQPSLFGFIAQQVQSLFSSSLPVDVRLDAGSKGARSILFFDGAPPASRAIRIIAQSSSQRHTELDLSEPARDASQRYHMDLSSDNGSLSVHLPLNFEGLLILRCLNGRIELSPMLKQHATLHPIPSGSDPKATYYHILPPHVGAEYELEEEDAESEMTAELPTATRMDMPGALNMPEPTKRPLPQDQCKIVVADSSRGPVRVDYYGEASSKKDDPKCPIS